MENLLQTYSVILILGLFTFSPELKPMHNSDVICALECPDLIVVSVNPGSPGAIVNYVVGATGCVTGAIQTSGLPSGSLFPVGTTSNCFLGEDEFGNTSQCCFDVVVEELVAVCPPSFVGDCGDSTNPDITGWPTVAGENISPTFGCYSTSYEDSESQVGNEVIITREWSIVNPCLSYSNFCTQYIYLSDNDGPELTCPNDVIVTCLEIDDYEVPPQAFDGCGSDFDLEFSDNNNDPDCGEIFIRTWLATDEFGNSSQCYSNIQITCTPTLQAENIIFENVNASSITLNWFNGNGNHRIVKINTVNSFSVPVNGSYPPANTDYNPANGQQVVLNDDADMVTVTGLMPNTTYWFRVFEGIECNGSTYYLGTPENGNPRSQITTNTNDPSSYIPGSILSPVKWVGSPGLYQSKLTSDLFNAPLTGYPCVKKECDEIEWRSNGMDWNNNLNHPNSTTPCEVLPKAITCFDYEPVDNSIKYDNLTWEFRQRGFITGSGGTEPNCNACACLLCNGDPCMPNSPTVSHGQNGCNSRDDRRAWDVNHITGITEVSVSVYAVEEGVVDFFSDYNIRLKHGTTNYWYSWYVYAKPVTGMFIGMEVEKNQYIGKIGVPMGVPAHMHFGLYYKEGNKFISVDRPIIKNTNRNVQVVPDDFTYLNLDVAGAEIGGAKIFQKVDNTWDLIGLADENGTFNAITIPAIAPGDSLRVVAGGYLTASFEFNELQNDLKTFNLPMVRSTESLNIVNPHFKPAEDSLFYKSPNLTLMVSGHGYSEFDVVIFKDSDEGPIYEVLSGGHAFPDTIVNIAMPNVGDNHIGIMYKGIDTVLLLQKYLYYPEAQNTISVSVKVDSTFLNSNMYVDGMNLGLLKDTLQLFDFPDDYYSFRFSKHGYIDTNYTINSNTIIQLEMRPNEADLYSFQDSVVMDFSINKIQYNKNVMVFDSLETSKVLIKQGYKTYPSNALLSLSRTIEFGKIDFYPETNLKARIVLDQIGTPSKDDFYIMRITDENNFTKMYPDSNLEIIHYDSAQQLIEYNDLNFSDGLYSKESLVLMKKLAPIVYSIPTFTLNYNDTVAIAFSQLFTDPDSLSNDLTYQITYIPQGASVEMTNDSLYLIANKCNSGSDSIQLSVTHDALKVFVTLHLNIQPPMPPTISIQGDAILCEGESLTLSTTSGSAYLWSDGQVTPSIIVNQEGVYSVTLTDVNGCTLISDNVQIISVDNPMPTIDPPSPDTLCAGELITLITETAVSYQWNIGTATQSILVGPGKYVVHVIDINGCEGTSDTVTVHSFEPLAVNVHTSGSFPFCKGDSVVFSAEPGYNYQWSNGSTDQATTVYDDGNYSLTIIDSHGCTGISNTYNISTYDVPVVDLGTDTSSTNLTFLLNAGNLGSDFYWNTGDTTQTLLISATGLYSVTVTNEFGCKGEDSVYVEFLTSTTSLSDHYQLNIYPNPNNGQFILTGNADNLSKLKIEVITPLGQVLYQAEVENISGKFEKEIQLDQISQGLYLIFIEIGNTKVAKKVVIY